MEKRKEEKSGLVKSQTLKNDILFCILESVSILFEYIIRLLPLLDRETKSHKTTE